MNPCQYYRYTTFVSQGSRETISCLHILAHGFENPCNLGVMHIYDVGLSHWFCSDFHNANVVVSKLCDIRGLNSNKRSMDLGTLFDNCSWPNSKNSWPSPQVPFKGVCRGGGSDWRGWLTIWNIPWSSLSSSLSSPSASTITSRGERTWSHGKH